LPRAAAPKSLRMRRCVGTLPDGYLSTSPLPRIDNHKYQILVSPVGRDFLGLHSSQPSLTAPICVWANRCGHNLQTTTVISTSSVYLFNRGVCGHFWTFLEIAGCPDIWRVRTKRRTNVRDKDMSWTCPGQMTPAFIYQVPGWKWECERLLTYMVR
jgi:hypothetical protein